MRITRIEEERSFTRQGPDGSYRKDGVRVEAELSNGDDPDICERALKGRLDAWLPFEGTQHQTSRPAQSVASTPAPAPSLNALGWKPFRTGREGGWVFSNRPEVKALVDRLKTAKDKTLIEGPWRFRLSGEGDRFLQRFPHKGKEAA